MRSKLPNYRAYLLRFWEEKCPPSDVSRVWRFSLEDPHSGERQGFVDLTTLVVFLQRQMEVEENSTLPSFDDSATST